MNGTHSLHDALPILQSGEVERLVIGHGDSSWTGAGARTVDEGGTAWSDEMSGGGRLVAQEGIERSAIRDPRSEEHTSELQSRGQLVCRHLLEKKNK